MDVQASPITRAVLDHLPVLEFLRANGAAPAADIAQATSRVPSNVRRDLPKLVEGGLLTRTPAGGDEGAVDAYALDAAAILALEAMDRARNPNLSAGAADGAVSMGVHSEFDRNPDQPRKKFKQEKLEQLADTIEAVGVLEPILVWPPNDAGVKIIWAGERRWRAVGIVNQRHDDPNRVRIPYVTRAPSEEEKAALIAEAAELALIENGQGEDLTSFEKAKALRSMVPSRYPSARAAAKVIGVHEKTAQDWLRALAELPAAVLKRWEDDELGWREVRDILRPGPKADADPAQIDIEEVTGTGLSPQQVPASLLSDRARDQTVGSKPAPTAAALATAYVDKFSAPFTGPAASDPWGAHTSSDWWSVEDRLIALELADKCLREPVAYEDTSGPCWTRVDPSVLHCRRLLNGSIIEFKQIDSPDGPTVIAKFHFNGGSATETGGVWGALTRLGFYNDRETALDLARKAAGVEPGFLGLYSTDWLNVENATADAPQLPEATGALSRAERVALIETTHKALTQNVAKAGRAARIGPYWLDAGCSRLKDEGLLTFVQAGGELGWCAMWGEKAYGWFKVNLPDVFNADGELAITDAQLALAQAEAATMEWTGPRWTGPGYVTPWLNLTDEVVAAPDEAPAIETDAETEADAEEVRARELLETVVNSVESPEALPGLLAEAGVRFPLKVGTGADLGVILDADGATLLTVDPDAGRPNAWVAAFALLVAAALEDAADGHEVTTEKLKPVIPPEKFKPADMRRSISPWAIVCLEDGRSFTSLKRHLQVVHGMTWDEYLTKWGLPKDYPSVAPATAQVRADAAWAVLQGLPK